MRQGTNNPPAPQPKKLRREVTVSDCDAVRKLVESTGVFSQTEVAIAVELIEERLGKGPVCGYEFVFAEQAGLLLGYACYGPIPLTQASYDLYWIAVHKTCQGHGIARTLLDEVERLVKQQGGQRLFIETSSRAAYEPARVFYGRCGYQEVAVIEDFYAREDHKVMFTKVL